MAYDIMATVIGTVDDRSTALRLASEIRVLAVRSGMLGCVVQVRDLRRAENIHYSTLYPRATDGE